MPGNERIAMKYFAPPTAKFRPYPTKKYLMGYVDVPRHGKLYHLASQLYASRFTKFVSTNVPLVATRFKIHRGTNRGNNFGNSLKNFNNLPADFLNWNLQIFNFRNLILTRFLSFVKFANK